jgi:hypothetical protein
MSAHNIVWLANVSLFTTHGGKNVRQPSVFKITQQHTNNWEIDILLTQCIVCFIVNVLSLGYGRIYSIISNDK